jgi:hypothetical protein
MPALTGAIQEKNLPLPFPILTSSGFLVMTFWGKNLVQTFETPLKHFIRN